MAQQQITLDRPTIAALKLDDGKTDQIGVRRRYEGLRL
jgi:hypothetical protein